VKLWWLAVPALCCPLLFGSIVVAQTQADPYQPPPEQRVQLSPPTDSAVVYLVNFSLGRSQFLTAPHPPRTLFRARSKDENVACDVAASTRFGQLAMSPGSWCRVYVSTGHHLWLWAETRYAKAQCSTFGCWKSSTVYYTARHQLTGLVDGGLYEYDACGAVGGKGRPCGFREIGEQDKTY
jgi:hypothetical protein